MPSWTCAECENEGNEGDACDACNEPRPAAPATGGAGGASGFKCGLVLSASPLKEKLKLLSVDVGAGAPLAIVTNAPNVVEGSRVVVACVGAALPDGTVVTKRSVGGASSEGIICDSPMLGWVGGGAGTAALVPDSFAVGAAPPSSRPRLK
jgi:tRNA-binding EMAP/Myf-like protein